MGISIDGKTVGKVKGNWRAKRFSIQIDGVEVAKIGRKRTIASTFMGADSYNITVTPKGKPVDLAFISLVCIALDEIYQKKQDANREASRLYSYICSDCLIYAEDTV